MRWLSLFLLTAGVGCQACPLDAPSQVEGNVTAAVQVAPDAAPWAAPVPPPGLPARPDLPFLWNLTLANNPDLRTASADVEAARGRWIQAGKYPNPRVIYEQEELGTAAAPAGAI